MKLYRTRFQLRHAAGIMALLLAFICRSQAVQAQVSITFDEADYQGVGVYDTWEQSPFRTGRLKGNARVIANPFKDAANQSDSVLAVQRSRFGSNTFGARIDLREPLATSETPVYVHVLVRKPNQSKVLLVGLGKRESFASEPTTVEQFWVESAFKPEADQWCDMVFRVRTVSGVKLHSLVVVPDLASPHGLKHDFACYIDQIEINGDPTQRTAPQAYAVRIVGKGQPLDGATLTCGKEVQRYQPDARLAGKPYQDASAMTVWQLSLGNVYTPAVLLDGKAVPTVALIDTDNDGRFDSQGLSVISLKGKDGLAPGIYRMRLQADADTLSAVSGTGFIDVLLRVHGQRVTANGQARNGMITTTDGRPLTNLQVAFGKPLKLRIAPAPGFKSDSVVVRHGFNLTGPAVVNGNRQWSAFTIHANQYASGILTLPAYLIDGDLDIVAEFAQVKENERE